MNAVQETYVPVQSNIIKPERPSSVVAPTQVEVHVITKDTAENKLNKADVYICYTWDDAIDKTRFERNILNYINQTNSILDYYEDTVDDLNKSSKENDSGNN
jgi:hypothetical protein